MSDRETQVPCQPDRPYNHLEAIVKGSTLVILGGPDQRRPVSEDQEETFGHNCDAMGCGTSHVLFRVDLRAFLVEREATTTQREPLHDSHVVGKNRYHGDRDGEISYYLVGPQRATFEEAEDDLARFEGAEELEGQLAGLRGALESAEHADDCPEHGFDAEPETCTCHRAALASRAGEREAEVIRAVTGAGFVRWLENRLDSSNHEAVHAIRALLAARGGKGEG